MPLEIDASIDPLQSHEAVLVSYQGETWIVTTKGRHAIDLTDRALTSSMGIPVTARPTPISEGMFNALPDMGLLAAAADTGGGRAQFAWPT